MPISPLTQDLMEWLRSTKVLVRPPTKIRRRARPGKRERIRLELLDRDPRCSYCRCPLTLETATLDHVQAKANGGPNTRDNLVLACVDCNQEKGDS